MEPQSPKTLKEYHPPQLTRYGDIRELVAGGTTGMNDQGGGKDKTQL